jgi:hypothetical protein
MELAPPMPPLARRPARTHPDAANHPAQMAAACAARGAAACAPPCFRLAPPGLPLLLLLLLLLAAPSARATAALDTQMLDPLASGNNVTRLSDNGGFAYVRAQNALGIGEGFAGAFCPNGTAVTRYQCSDVQTWNNNPAGAKQGPWLFNDFLSAAPEAQSTDVSISTDLGDNTTGVAPDDGPLNCNNRGAGGVQYCRACTSPGPLNNVSTCCCFCTTVLVECSLDGNGLDTPGPAPAPSPAAPEAVGAPSPPPRPAAPPPAPPKPPRPAPPAPPPPLPPGVVPPASLYVVSSSATLGGVTAASFSPAASASFTAGMAATLGVATSTVAVTGVADVTGHRRRHVLQAGAAVAFTVSSAVSPTALLSSLQAIGSNPSALLAAFSSAGLVVAGVVVSQPTVAQVSALGSASAQAAYLSSLLPPAGAGGAASGDAAAAAGAAAAAALNHPDSPLNSNATAAAAARATLLSALAPALLAGTGSGGNGTQQASAASLQSVASAVSALVANSSQINAPGAAAALSVFAAVAASGSASSSGSVITNATGHAVVSGLSSIVDAARAPDNDVMPAAVLPTVMAVVTNLTGSMLSGMPPGAPAATVSSPNIQALVQVDVVASADASSRLFAAPITAPGSASSFAPLPASLFAAASGSSGAAPAAVCTTFHSLTFDPFTGAANSTGVTRLLFTDAADGSEVPVAGLAAPIYFTLPPVSGLSGAADGSGAKAACQFWDTDASAYATHGCVGIPDPQPANHTLSWLDNFSAATDADMAGAWSGAGPLFDGCTAVVMDCGNTTDPPPPLPPNPAQPFSQPLVTCNASVSTAPLLVFVGSGCALIAPDNVYGCAWSNFKQVRKKRRGGAHGRGLCVSRALTRPLLIARQAFVGAGCAASGEPTQCACRHVRLARDRLPCLHACAGSLLACTPDFASLFCCCACAAHRFHQRHRTHGGHLQRVGPAVADAARHHRRPEAAADCCVRRVWRHEHRGGVWVLPGRARAARLRGGAAAPGGWLPRRGRQGAGRGRVGVGLPGGAAAPGR